MKKMVLVAIGFLLLSISLFSQSIDASAGDDQKVNLLGVGYQVGGQTLIGVDYSWRLSRFFGVHMGGGFSGYAAGINLYLSPKYTSSFFSVNYEDGGFGLLSLVTVKWNGLIGFGAAKKHGIYYNIGVAGILGIDSELKEELFNGEDQNVMPTVALGYGFRL